MYDLPGGDTGREWVEVTNTGSATVNLTTYRLFEADTNHKISIALGGAVLASGASAVIADNAAKFKTDWPTYTGVLFESAFSLSNTGETFSLKNGTSTTEDSVSYTSSWGGAGDSGSLHREGNSFVSALPTPGVFPGVLAPVPKAEKPAPIVKDTSAATKNKTTKTIVTASSKQVAAVQNSDVDTTPTNPLLFWILGLAGIVALGVAGVVYAGSGLSPRTPFSQVTKGTKDEFKIIED